jgi:hypothetical protein
MALEDALAKVPFLAGYLGQQQFEQKQQSGQLGQMGSLLQIQEMMRQRKQEEDLNAAMKASGGDLEKALPALIQAGHIKGEHLTAAIKLLSDAQARREAIQAMKDLNAPPVAQPTQPQELGIGKPLGSETVPQNPNDSRLIKLKAMQTQYAGNPTVSTAIQKEMDKIESDKKPIFQMISLPGNKEQPHMSFDLGKTFTPVPGSSPRDIFASTASNSGVTFLQDSNNGDKYKVHKDGTAFKAMSDGSWSEIPFAQIPASAAKLGAGGGQLGNRESVFINRVILSGNEAARDLENVVKLPMSADRGIFGGRTQGPGIFAAGKESLANQMTTQEVQSYNVLATGFQRSLAAIEASGLAPNVNLSHQMDAVIFKAGDTNFTKLQKLAQTRQIVEAGLETITSNPRVPEATKNHIKEILAKVEKAVPFTQGDLIDLQGMQNSNPNMTLGDVLKAKRVQELRKKRDATN